KLLKASDMTKNYGISLLAAALIGIGTAAYGQSADTSGQGCQAKAQPTEPATAPKDSSTSGSQNMGSTGWTGGKGVNASDDGPSKGSGSYQPETAKGLDLKKDAGKSSSG